MRDLIVVSLMKELKGKERGFLNESQKTRLEEILDIKDKCLEELRFMRNFYVMTIADFISQLKEDNSTVKDIMFCSDIMSAVTGVIDNAIYQKGGQV